jgi:hypothetical protein
VGSHSFWHVCTHVLFWHAWPGPQPQSWGHVPQFSCGRHTLSPHVPQTSSPGTHTPVKHASPFVHVTPSLQLYPFDRFATWPVWHVAHAVTFWPFGRFVACPPWQNAHNERFIPSGLLVLWPAWQNVHKERFSPFGWFVTCPLWQNMQEERFMPLGRFVDWPAWQNVHKLRFVPFGRFVGCPLWQSVHEERFVPSGRFTTAPFWQSVQEVTFCPFGMHCPFTLQLGAGHVGTHALFWHAWPCGQAQSCTQLEHVSPGWHTPLPQTGHVFWPGWHTPFWHVSGFVHALPSLHDEPVSGAFEHTPAVHVSAVHALPSLHCALLVQPVG